MLEFNHLNYGAAFEWQSALEVINLIAPWFAELVIVLHELLLKWFYFLLWFFCWLLLLCLWKGTVLNAIVLIRTNAYKVLCAQWFVCCSICWIALLLYLPQALHKVRISSIILFKVANEVIKHFVCLMHCWLSPQLLVHLAYLHFLVKYLSNCVSIIILWWALSILLI